MNIEGISRHWDRCRRMADDWDRRYLLVGVGTGMVAATGASLISGRGVQPSPEDLGRLPKPV